MQVAQLVLCLPSEKVPGNLFKEQSTKKLSWEEAVSLVLNGSCVFVKREKAEKAGSYKQLFFNVMIRNIRGDILCYSQTSEDNETDCDRCSLGIAGRISKDDFGDTPKRSKIGKAVHPACERKLRETVGVHEGFDNLTFLGIVHERQSDTGKGCIVLVYEYSLSPHGMIRLGEELGKPQWVSPDEIKQYEKNIDPWSRHALELMQ